MSKTSVLKDIVIKHWPILLLMMATFFVYKQTANFDFLLYDDNRYVSNNDDIKDFSFEGLIKHFNNQQYSSDLIPPLTLVSLSINYAFSELNAGAYHLTNVWLHLANILLVYLLVLRIGKTKHAAIFVAFVFALHPAATESVSWVSARKEVQYTFFYLLAALLTLKFWKSKQHIHYVAVVVLFILSYFSKYAAASFPIFYVVMAILWQKRKDYAKVALESLPFFLLPLYSFILSIMGRSDGSDEEVVAQGGEAMLEATQAAEIFYEALSWGDKFVLAGHSLSMYIGKFFFPINQQIIYPYPIQNENGSFDSDIYATAIIGALLVIGLIIFLVKKPQILSTTTGFGLLFFAVNIALLLHILPIGGRVVIADRYTYLPYIGLSIVTFQIIQNTGKWPRNAIYAIGAVALLFLTTARIPDWKNTETIFADLAEKEPELPLAHNMVGLHHYTQSNYAEALKHFQKVIAIEPSSYTANLNIGSIYIHQNKIDQALQAFIKARATNPNTPGVHFNIGGVYVRKNMLDMALEAFKASLNHPDFGHLHHKSLLNMGLIYQSKGDMGNATTHFKYCVEHKPEFTPCQLYYGKALMQTNNHPKAAEHLTQAVKLDPNNNEARMDLISTLLIINRHKEALAQSKGLLRKGERSERAFYLHGTALHANNNLEEACEAWRLVKNLPEAQEQVEQYCR